MEDFDEELLSPLERDALTELVNIGMGGAASGLRQLVNRPVLLAVPALEVVNRTIAIRFISERGGEHLIAVKEEFSGAFSGEALLIFPEPKSLALARAVLGDDEGSAAETDLDEALIEIGNIILGRCVGTIANQLDLPVTLSLPHIARGTGHSFFIAELNNDDLVLILHIDFKVVELNTRGYIALLMPLPSLGRLKEALAKFIDWAMNNTQ